MTRYEQDIELDEIEFDEGKLRSLLTEIKAMQEKASRLRFSIAMRRETRELRMREQRELAEAVR